MNKQQLANKIWASANKMRSKIEANEYKDYILGFIFYKFLSDQEVKWVLEHGMTEDTLPEYLKSEGPEAETIVKWVQDNLGYFIDYDDLYSTWLKKGKNFSIANVRDALSAFSRLVSQTHKKVFDEIFDTLQTGLKKLGATDAEQTKAVHELLFLIKDIPMNDKQDYDVLGFIYEYLISQFAANAGKKAGEFYTPHEVSLLMSEIVAHHLRDREKIEIYDPTSGSGSLLINIGKAVSHHIQGSNTIKYYAQELKKNTYNLTRMNLIMRGIIPANIVTRNGDTLKDDWPYFDENNREATYNPLFVDAVVSNPPYSQPWEPPKKNENADPRFDFGIAPKGKADYAFLLHDLYHLKSDGIMTIVLPHGVLFRGEAGDPTDPNNPGDLSEGSIRRQLVENNNIDTIIGLPADIFFGTGIPTIIIVLRKERGADEDTGILFIDASKGYIKEGKKNKLRASDIKRIVDTYIAREDIPKFSRLVSKDELRRNGYNLNIPRYVNSSDDPETWDIYATMFGGVPKTELAAFDEYWDALPHIREELFNASDTPYTSFATHSIESTVKGSLDVINFAQDYRDALGDFDQYLYHRLIGNMLELNIVREQDEITRHIFYSLESVKLVDRFAAYQLFADKWSIISQDLEIIQSEGFDCIRQVDPNMVSNDKDEEVQDGWVGHILPFEIVQLNNSILLPEWQALEQKNVRVAEASNELTSLFGELPEDVQEVVSNDNGEYQPKMAGPYLSELIKDVETPEIIALNRYLALSRKADKLAFIAAHPEIEWSEMKVGKNGTYPKGEVGKFISQLRLRYPFAEDSVEAMLVKLLALSSEIKTLKSEIKLDSYSLHEHTREVIENELTDEDIHSLLSVKWIESLCDHLNSLPADIIDGFIERLVALHKKYEVTLKDVENDIKEASTALSSMLDELTGNEFDMAALAEFRNLLAYD